MTTLIYRGIAHDGKRSTTPRKPMNLVYRGVAHDGLSAPATPSRRYAATMCYRGVRYVLRAAETVMPVSEPRGTGQLAGVAA